jgi:hypothetical protein
MRCAISRPPPISIGGWASPSVRATVIRRSGGRKITSSSWPASIWNCSAWATRRGPSRTARGIFFSFGAFNRDFLARGEGLSMLALEGRGAPDADAFRGAGIGDFEPFELAREARRADGTTVRLAFTLTFASDPKAPDLGVFAIRHHFPEHFWNPAVQIHDNTVTAVAGVVLVADNPSDHQIFLSALIGEREWLPTSAGIAIKTARGEIQVFTPTAFRDHFGTAPPDTAKGARFAAVRFAVRDREALLAALEAGKVRSSQFMGRIVVGPEVALGATLAFEGN